MSWARTVRLSRTPMWWGLTSVAVTWPVAPTRSASQPAMLPAPAPTSRHCQPGPTPAWSNTAVVCGSRTAARWWSWLAASPVSLLNTYPGSTAGAAAEPPVMAVLVLVVGWGLVTGAAFRLVADGGQVGDADVGQAAAVGADLPEIPGLDRGVAFPESPFAAG